MTTSSSDTARPIVIDVKYIAGLFNSERGIITTQGLRRNGADPNDPEPWVLLENPGQDVCNYLTNKFWSKHDNDPVDWYTNGDHAANLLRWVLPYLTGSRRVAAELIIRRWVDYRRGYAN